MEVGYFDFRRGKEASEKFNLAACQGEQQQGCEDESSVAQLVRASA